jgi:hypothetical protein
MSATDDIRSTLIRAGVRKGMIRELRFVYRRLICAVRGHRFRARFGHVTCTRCNWCGGDALGESLSVRP